MSYFRSINQAVTVSSGNTDSSNLPVNGIFTGLGESTLGVNAIQVNLHSDQNCIVYVDQGPDASTFYISDSFNYYAGLGGNAWTTQATDAFTRVRVKNVGLSPTTNKVVSTVLCPIVEALPRALSAEGNLKVGVYEIEGAFGSKVTVSPMSALKVAQSTRLVGATFQGDTTDSNFWTTSATGTGLSSQTGGQLTLATGATASSTIRVNTNRRARYVAANTNYFRGQITAPTQTAACIRRWGAFDTADGYYYQYDGTNLDLMARKSSVDSTVANGTFNGIYGTNYNIDTSCNIYEIYWTNKKAYYFVNDELLHTLSAPTTPAVSTLTLPVGLECNNGTGNTANNTLVVRVASISRLGQLTTQPTSYYRNTTTTGIVLKWGAGNLHRIIVGTAATSGAVVTLYDGTSTGGVVLATFTFTWPAGGNFNPNSFDFQGLPFSTGLFLVVATQAVAITVIYE